MRPGICGLVSLNEKEINPSAFSSMQENLSGRSPNKKIIENWYALAQAGYESTGYEKDCLLHSADRTICFEGRIDNRRQLAIELGINEDEACYENILSRGFSVWGPHFYQKIHGAFTICIILPEVQKFILANDHMGLRPLYLSEIENSQLAFGSDVSQLLAINGSVPSLNRSKVLEMLSPLYVDDEGWSDPESTLLQGYSIMPHATFIEMDRQGNQTKEQYWNPPTELRRDWADITECAQEFRHIYTKVIAEQIDSQYPIGADLSGGIDSGCNVAVAAHLLQQQYNLDRDFHTFTATFGKDNFAEKYKIDAVLSKWPSIQQHYIQGDDLCGYLESGKFKNMRTTANCVRMNIPESYVAICQLASQLGCRSIMSGEAADWYLEGTDVIWDSLIKSGKLPELIKSAGVLKKRATWKTLMRYLYLYGIKPLTGRNAYITEYYESTLSAEVPELFTDAFSKELQEFIRDQGNDLLKRKQLSVWNQQLEHELMFPPNHGWQGIAVDTELRLPYLDRRLIEFGLSVPPEYKFRYGEDRVSHYGSRKCLQRYGLNDMVPEEIIQCQNKAAYDAPVDNRLAQSLPVVFANSETAMITEMGITDSKKLKQAIEYVLSDKCNDPADPVMAWLDTLLGLELWLKATDEDFGLK